METTLLQWVLGNHNTSYIPYDVMVRYVRNDETSRMDNVGRSVE